MSSQFQCIKPDDFEVLLEVIFGVFRDYKKSGFAAPVIKKYNPFIYDFSLHF